MAERIGQSAEALSAYSREMIEKGSKSFARAATLMPGDVRDSVYMLYAWCRYCDDVIDDQHLGFSLNEPRGQDDIATRVESLRRKTRAAYRGEAEEAPFQALALVARKHEIPERFALDLIDGFAMDATGQFYANEEDTLRYCYHVAGAVGVMMAMIMGARDRPTLLRACDLGLAFQMTNISRDVTTDAQAGRVYLPSTWLDDVGLNADQLDDSTERDKLFSVVRRLLDTADQYYNSASYGVARLPFRSAWSIASAHRIYRAIGEEIRQAGPAAWDRRAATNRRQKMYHVALASVDATAAVSWGRVRPTVQRVGLWTPPALRSEAGNTDPGVDELMQAPV